MGYEMLGRGGAVNSASVIAALAGQAIGVSRVTASAGTITTSQPNTIDQTWNDGSVTFVAWSIDIIDTASASGSVFWRIRRNGSDYVKVQKGNLSAYANIPYLSHGADAFRGALFLLPANGIGVGRANNLANTGVYIGGDVINGITGVVSVDVGTGRGKIGIAGDPFQEDPNPYLGRAALGIFSVHSTNDSVGGSFAYPAGASNTAISGTVNNLALDASAFQRLTGSSTPVVTGIAPPASSAHSSGNERRLYNVGATAIQFNHNDAGSTAANRLFFQGAANVSVAQNECLLIQYDATDNGSGAAGWRARKLSN